MRFHLRTDGISTTEALRQFTERKIHFALGRFSQRVRDVRMQIIDVNGPKKSDDDVECRIQANLGQGGVLTIVERSHDPFAATARAAQRLARSASRRIERLHTRRKGRR